MANGGARPGAGRPRGTASIVKDDKIVLRKLRGGAEAGWEVLAEEYPSIIRLAIAVATGAYSDNKPNVSMLKTLLELLPKVVGPEADAEDSPLNDLLRSIRANLTTVDINIKSPVDIDVSRDNR